MNPSVLRPLLAIVGLAAIALGSLAWFGGSGEAPAPIDAPLPVVAASSQPGTEVSADFEEETGPTPSADGWDEPERREVEPVTDPGVPALPVQVRVVDGITGAPVARAEVFWALFESRQQRDQFGDLPSLDRRRISGSRLVAVGLIEGGQRRITDDSGETLLPANPWRAAVAARTLGRIGFAELARGKGDLLEVRLVEDVGIGIQVVDANGAPRAGVPVVITRGNAPNRAAALWRGESGAEGIARVPFFRLVEQSGAGSRFVAALQMPLARPEFREFGTAPLPTDPIVLRLPGMARVEVTVVDRQGLPIESSIGLWTMVKHDPEQFGGAPLPADFDVVYANKPHGAHSAIIEPVGLGMQMSIGVRFREGGRADRFASPTLPGPVVDGETMKIQVVAPEWLTLLRGRMLGPNGEPWIDAQVPSQLRDASRVWLDTEIRTDHDGQFELVTRIEGEVAPPALLEMTEGMPDGTRLVGMTAVAGLGPGQRIELGDVQLRAVPPLVEGVCVDELGRPIANARLQVQAAVDGKRFVDGGLARGATDERGEFRLYGVPPTGALRLHAAAEKHIGDVVPLLAAGSRLEVTLMRSVDLRLRIQLPPGVPEKAVRAELRGGDGQARELDLNRSRRGDVATYAGDDLPRGIFDLAVQVRNFPGDLRVLRSLVLEPDTDSKQRRIDIDLRDALFGYQVEVIGPGNVVDPSVRGVLVARTIKPDGSLDWQAFQVERGVASFVAPLTSLESVLIPQGRGEVRTWLQPGVNRLFSSPIFPAELTLPGMRAMAADATVRISLVLIADTGLPQGIRGVDQRTGGTFGLERALTGKSGGGWLDANDHVSVPVSRNGRYQVVARVQGRGRGGQQSRVIGEVDVVVDGVAPTNVVVPFDQKQFEKALEASRKRG